MKDNATDAADPFLQRLGEKVRTMRSRRGMSRKVLARHSDVSERYLAQLEAGEGNCSIQLLRRVADAMSVPVADLVDDRPERPLEAMLLDQFLGRLTPAEIAEARELLIGRFGGPSSAMRRDRIALIGLRGGGKSTIGSLLAKRQDVPFVELDRVIEQKSGMPLGEMIEMFGQETFRRHRGRVWVEGGSGGRGSRFVMELPLATGSEVERDDPPHRVRSTEEARGEDSGH
jgi:XRE family aerobic/anaerobic benzoate catabolism transcriptional regulator